MMEKELTKDWIETTLGESFLIERGGSPRPIEDYITDSEDGINWIKIGDTKNVNKFIYSTKEKIKPEGLKKSRMVYDGDFILSNSMSFGRPYIMKTNGCIHDGWLVIRKNENIDNNFLYYLLNSNLVYQQFSSLAKGSTVKNLNIQAVQKVKVALPPLNEQIRIAFKLDTLFAHLEHTKKRLEQIPVLLKQFRQAVLTQAVTGKLTEEWREGKELGEGLQKILDNRLKYYSKLTELSQKTGSKKPKKLDDSEFEFNYWNEKIELPDSWNLANLKNITDLITDGEHATPKRTESGKYLLSARNVRDGFIALENVDYVPDDEFNRIRQRCNPEPNDILISCSGSVGRISIVPKDIEFVLVRSVALLKLQSNQKSAKYLSFCLMSNFIQEQMLSLQKSTAQANLFIGPIGKIVVPIPSLEEQTEIVRQVESLFAKADAIEVRYKVLKELVNKLPQAILGKAFRGEV